MPGFDLSLFSNRLSSYERGVNSLVQCVVVGAVVGTAFAGAGVEVQVGQEGDWCLAIPADVGVLVDVPEATWVQYLRVGAYVHWQSTFVDGEAGGRDFWYGRGWDWRRTRLTAKARVLDAVSLMTHVNLSSDEGRDGGGVEIDYQGVFLAWAELDLNRVSGSSRLDSWDVGYGKRKLGELNEEMDTSVNAILTVERSSFAAQLVPFRAATGTTGAWMKGMRGNEAFSIGVYTTDASPEFGNWSDGTLVVGAWEHDFRESWGMEEATLSLGGGWQDVEEGDEVYAAWEWVITPWLKLKKGPFLLRVSAAFGENEGPETTTGGGFYGASITPVYEWIPDRLQLVGRYTVMGSEGPHGVQLTSRYAREAGRAPNEDIPDLASGRGDFHQSVYGGAVWWVCPQRMSVLAGVEWEQLESRDMKVYSGLTGWFAMRLIY
ncbi:MAG: hypothetical protein ACQKBU_07040 [Verrucomicrobiales bacterium]